MAAQDRRPAPLTVIILNWNNPGETSRCIEAVAAWERIKPGVIVVDNGSRDGSADELGARFPDVTVIRSEANLGYTGGNNLAIKKALEKRADYLLLLNNDASLAEAGISRLVRTMDERPDLGIVGPLIREGSATYAGGTDIGRRLNTRVAWSPAMGSGVKLVDYVPGTALLIRRQAIERAGLLDDDYFFSGEAADLCRRVYDAGMACGIDLRSEATHSIAEYSRVRDTLYIYYNLRNRFLYVKKHYRGWRLPILCRLAGYCIRESLFSLAKGNTERTRAALLALADGVAGRFGDYNDRFIA